MTWRQDGRGRLQMARVVQCPNPSCGRTSHLGEDPLGRIFRCPRCLTKLPTAEVSAVDSGWTNVLGPLPRRSSSPSSGSISALESIARPSVQNSLSWDRIPARLIGSTSLPSSLRACDSGEFSVEPFEIPGRRFLGCSFSARPGFAGEWRGVCWSIWPRGSLGVG